MLLAFEVHLKEIIYNCSYSYYFHYHIPTGKIYANEVNISSWKLKV